MISKYEKTNGVKLLAAVMVMAMVVAGAAVVLSDSEVNAANPVSTTDITTVTGYSEGAVTLTEGKAYYVPSNATITVSTAIDVDLYVKNGVTVTLKGSNATSIDIFAVANYTTGSATQVDGLQLIASQSYADNTYTAGSNYITTTDTVASTSTVGIAVTNNDTETTYYPVGTNMPVDLTTVKSVKIINGGATVSQGENSVTISNIVTDGDGITVTAGDSTYPSISGTIEGADASVTVTGGKIGYTSTGITGINAVAVSLASGGYYTNQFAVDADATGYSINGTITQRTSVDLGDKTISVAAGNTLIINNNVSVKSTGAVTTLAGAVVVYGSFDVGATTITDAATAGVYVGPNGYINGITASTSGKIYNTSVNTYTENSFISGEFSGSPTGDFIIADDGKGLTIPAGTTFTLSGNLGLNGQTLTVEGTLVIENRASIFDCGNGEIVLGAKGSIQNNGTIGKIMPVTIADASDNSITLQGVTGVSFGFVKVGNENVFGVSGDIKAASGASVSKITIKGAYITGDFTTAKKVITVIDASSDVNMSKNVAVVINGDLQTNDKAILVSEGSSVTINGKVTKDGTAATGADAIKAKVGKLNPNDINAFIEEKSVSIKFGTNVSGVTLSVSRVAVADETDATKTNYFLRAYVSGNVDVIDSTTSDAETVIVTTADGTGYYNLYIAAETALNVAEDAKLTLTGGTVVIEGSIVGEDGSTITVSGKYIGAHYTVVTGETTNQTTTEYYTTLAAAMDAIETAEDKTVDAVVDTLDINVTVKNGQTLNLTVNKEISQDAILTIENGGVQAGEIKDVQGKMVVYVDATADQPANYAVVTVDAEETTIYSGFAIAISEAGPGDEITVEKAEVTGSLTIPAGVTVNINGSLTVGKDLTVSDEAVLNGGTITVNGTKITVNGTMDVSEGSLSATTATLTSPGTTIVGATLPTKFNGAYYLNADSDYVITSVTNAVKYATENAITIPVGVKGTVSETGELALDGVNLNIDAGADVRLGNVTLTGATIAATGELTATVSGLNGEGDAAVNGAVTLNKSAVTLKASSVTNAAGVDVHTFAVSGIVGTMTVSAGQVVFADVTAQPESKLTVASGATMLLNANGTTFTVEGDNVEFVVEGTLAVENGASVVFDAVGANGKVAVIAGTMDISGNASVSVVDLAVTGTVNVSAVENDEGALEVTGALTLGSEPKSVGTAGAVVGEVELSTAGVIIAYAGADVSGLTVTDSTGNALTENYTTQFYINGAVYMTAYGAGADISAALAVPEFKLEGYDKPADPAITSVGAWKLENDDTASDGDIGSVDALYLEVEPVTVTISVSAGSQISIYIDSVRITGNTYSLTVGTHNVTATVNPGYTGEVTIAINGQAVTGGTIEITSDMTKDNTTLSATGQISVDTGSTSGSSDGMGLTEILLVILVILIVVMAIMVALRLMRS